MVAGAAEVAGGVLSAAGSYSGHSQLGTAGAAVSAVGPVVEGGSEAWNKYWASQTTPVRPSLAAEAGYGGQQAGYGQQAVQGVSQAAQGVQFNTPRYSASSASGASLSQVDTNVDPYTPRPTGSQARKRTGRSSGSGK
jgi:hypothetical protein